MPQPPSSPLHEENMPRPPSSRVHEEKPPVIDLMEWVEQALHARRQQLALHLETQDKFFLLSLEECRNRSLAKEGIGKSPNSQGNESPCVVELNGISSDEHLDKQVTQLEERLQTESQDVLVDANGDEHVRQSEEGSFEAEESPSAPAPRRNSAEEKQFIYEGSKHVLVRSFSKKFGSKKKPASIRSVSSSNLVQGSRFERLVTSVQFELVFGALIVLSTICMCIEAEYQGLGRGHKLGVSYATSTSHTGDDIFDWIDFGFVVIFTVEVIMKLIGLRLLKFIRSYWNLFDTGIIFSAWYDMSMTNSLPVPPMLIRLVRLFRLLRLLRELSQYEFFDTLQLMVKGIKASIPVLVWVLVLTCPILTVCALGMNYATQDFIEDTGRSETVRVQCYEYFGTFMKAMISMCEVTYANWAPITRFLYDNVGKGYAIFFVAYKYVVGIAVLRVIYGVFLHVTLECASQDDDALIEKKRREIRKYSQKMQQLFNEMDSSGDGFLSKAEFLELAEDFRVKHWLAAMDLEVRDAELVYALTDDGDGKMSVEEMVLGFSRMKGNARSLDIMSLIEMVRKAFEKVDVVHGKLDHHIQHMAALNQAKSNASAPSNNPFAVMQDLELTRLRPAADASWEA